MTNRELFLQNWNNFLSELRGKLLTTARTQELSLPLANLILSELACYWFSSSDVKGAWLNKYCNTHINEGQCISNILTNDLKFSTKEEATIMSNSTKYLLSIAGAAIGFGLSTYFDTTRTIKIIATLTPMLASFPVLNAYQEKQKISNQKRLIDNYISQLKKIETSICSIIKD